MSQMSEANRASFDRLLLPDGVQEVMPPISWRLERARRELLDLYWRWGFDLIRPPLIEYLDSLLTGAAADLDVQTFKLTDQVNGRMMGVRSDMTTQVARIDAQRIATHGPGRYCYIGSVLRTRAEEPGGSRVPLQIGVEKFGDAGLAADLEIVSLMLESVHLLGIEGVGLDLGHVQIYRRLIARAELDPATDDRLFDIVQRKSRPDLDALAATGFVDQRTRDRLAALIDLNGGTETLERARRTIGGIDAGIDHALDELGRMIDALAARYPTLAIFLDFAELRGYRYKTGLLFAAFAPGHGRELARGGRYDDIGKAFGHGRPATGFSADLNVLMEKSLWPAESSSDAVFAPADDDPALAAEIRRLRGDGRRVVVAGSGTDNDSAAFNNCAYELFYSDGRWQVAPASCQPEQSA